LKIAGYLIAILKLLVPVFLVLILVVGIAVSSYFLISEIVKQSSAAIEEMIAAIMSLFIILFTLLIK